MNLIYWECENFGIFEGKFRIDFNKIPKESAIGIFGINEDGEGGYDSNGSGKSTFVSSICWNITDKMPQQLNKDTVISKSDIVNKSANKRASVTLGILNEQTNDLIEFTNSRTPGGDRKTKLVINGKEFEAEKDAQRVERFHSLIGFGGKKKEYFIDFMNHTFFNGDITNSFANKDFSPAKRIEIISRIKQLEPIDGCIKDLSEEIKLKNMENQNCLFDINVIKEKHDPQFDSKLALTQKEEIEKTLSETIENIESLEELNKIYIDIENKESNLNNIKNSLVIVERKIDENLTEIKIRVEDVNLEKLKIPRYEQQIKDLSEEIIKIENLVNIKNESITSIKNEESNLINKYYVLEKETQDLSFNINNLNKEKYLDCPHCNGSIIVEKGTLKKFDLDLHEKILKETIQEHNIKTVELGRIKNDIEAKRKQLEQINIDVNSFNRQIRESERNKDSLYNLINQFNRNLLDINKFVEESNNIYKLLDKYKNYDNYDDWNNIKSKIILKTQELEEIKNNPELIDWFNEYPKDTILSNINSLSEQKLNNNLLLRDINNKLEYNDKLKLDLNKKEKELIKIRKELDELNKEINVFQKLKAIEVDESGPTLQDLTNKILEDLGTGIQVIYDVNIDNNKFDISLIEDSGKDLPLALFSSGQSRRISLAAGASLRDLNIDNKVDLGFTIWDEVFDSLDNSGQELFSSLLNSFKGYKFVVSHSEEMKKKFKYKIICHRKNHKTKIYLEEQKND